ncbi:MAG: flagellar hook protein FlgE [Spirochaetaceae bacterium]|nr:flagellar hook protein FlgE [Spirochaetaceae bacterium]
MMRSLYAGVSGLQNHQTRMDVVGHNIANVNTIGYKKNRVNFQDMLAQTLQGAARPTEELGGVNPKQVGLGMSVAAIDTIHTQGALQSTGVATDVAIQGSGFFVLRKGEQEFYTRAGAFGIDENGTLVNPSNGLRVQGWMTQVVDGVEILNTSADPSDLIIPVGGKDPAFATTEVMLACNLDKRLNELTEGSGLAETMQNTWTINKTIYDSFGNKHEMSIDFTKVPGEPNRWRAEVFVNRNAEADSQTAVDVGANNNEGNVLIIQFGNDGLLLSAEDEQGAVINEGVLQIPVSFNVPDTTIPEGQESVRQTFNLTLGEIGSAKNTITQFAEKNSTKSFYQNGYALGYLENFRIDSSGIITGVYSNGTNRAIGQIALSNFVNAGGLEKIGDTMFARTNNSGFADIGVSGVAGRGTFIAGTLEMSNVDLSEQFTDMIVTQRGFQANSKTIQTADQMLQELLTLKR